MNVYAQIICAKTFLLPSGHHLMCMGSGNLAQNVSHILENTEGLKILLTVGLNGD